MHNREGTIGSRRQGKQKGGGGEPEGGTGQQMKGRGSGLAEETETAERLRVRQSRALLRIAVSEFGKRNLPRKERVRAWPLHHEGAARRSNRRAATPTYAWS